MNKSVVSSERLDLIPLSLEFLAASLAGKRAAAAGLVGLSIPVEWFAERGLMEIRRGQLEADPELEPWLLRAIGRRADGEMVGHIGFHTRPGAGYLAELAPGGVELGYTVYPAHRRQGYAREAVGALMDWAWREHGVIRFVASIRPDNTPSLRLVAGFGFEQVGSQVDEEDGLEEIYVRSLG